MQWEGPPHRFVIIDHVSLVAAFHEQLRSASPIWKALLKTVLASNVLLSHWPKQVQWPNPDSVEVTPYEK